MPRKKQQEVHSCADCKHRHELDRESAECRAHPMVYIHERDTWASPPAPDDFLCGEHLIRCNS
jgi:hypothetical protein